MSNILQKICEDKSKELEETKKRCSFKTLEKLISSKLEKREFKDQLISAQKNKKNLIIGEVKKQSPSAGEIISDYGEGKDQHKLKNGLVFKVKEDSFVTSPMNGTVVYANKFKSFGNLVMIKDNKGFTSVLIGMRNLLISTGNEVFVGEPIAKISSTLQSQLYFELRENGKIVDPKSKVEIL